MDKQAIIAAIDSLKEQAANLQCCIAALEQLINEEPQVEETPVIEPIEEEVEELPAPPAEVHIDIPDEDVILGCSILTALPDFYDGKCSVLKIHKRYFDNGQPKLYIDKYHVVIEAYNASMKLLGSYVTHWNNLSKFHVELIKMGINTHSKDNWKPKTILLDLD